MKKYIRASRYSDEADRNLKFVGFLGSKLHEITSTDDPNQIQQICSDMGKMFSQHADDKADLIEAILQNMEWHLKEYRYQQTRTNAYPNVTSDVLQAARDFGFSVEQMSDPDTYRLADPEQTNTKLMNEFCSYLRKNLGVKWDTGLGGSWTAHSGSIDGITIHVGCERDYDLDPQGGTWTLQLEF